MKFYTMISKKNILQKANDSYPLNWRDVYALKTFGGRIFTEQMFIDALKQAMDDRGNSQKTQKIAPIMVWKRWLSRGAIVELNG